MILEASAGCILKVSLEIRICLSLVYASPKRDVAILEKKRKHYSKVMLFFH